MADGTQAAAYESPRDPYFYIMMVLGWIGVAGVLVALWAQTPWFPWK